MTSFYGRLRMFSSLLRTLQRLFFYSAANLKAIWWERWEKTEWLLDIFSEISSAAEISSAKHQSKMPCICHAAIFPTTFVPRDYVIEYLSKYYNLLWVLIYIYISGVCMYVCMYVCVFMCLSLMISETTGPIILKFGMWVPLAQT